MPPLLSPLFISLGINNLQNKGFNKRILAKEVSQTDLRFFYEKNPLYRVVYTDGLIGGLTPTGAINLNFYATRSTIPKSVLHTIEEGKLSPKGIPSEDSKKGVMREIEIGIYMNKKTAREIYEFLKKFVESEEK